MTTLRAALLVVLAAHAAGCAGRGQLRYHHHLSPPQAAAAGRHAVRVERVSGVEPTRQRHRVIPRFWVELELANHGDQPWELRIDDLHMLPEGRRAAGFAAVPTALPDAQLDASATVGPGGRRTVWARFDQVRTRHAVASRTGVEAMTSLSLAVRSPTGPLLVALIDPAGGEPLWTPRERSRFVTFGLGAGAGIGEDSTADAVQAAMSLDFSASAHHRFGELDVGLVGQLRAGLEAHPIDDGVYSFYGGGVTTGYTFQLGDTLYLRPAVTAVIGRAGHPGLEATPLLLAGEVQVGAPRRSAYPYRERIAAFTIGGYLRVETRAATLSEVDEPHLLGVGIGLLVRGGS
jgi:hypothetical protein